MSRSKLWNWLPAALLLVGTGATYGGVREQVRMPLQAPLDRVVPTQIDGHASKDIVISEGERKVAGMSNYVMRLYHRPGQPVGAGFSVYVGYYESQQQGKTIHSPKNCLPGGGWEPLVSDRPAIQTPLGEVRVNRYLIQNGDQKALVLYWYQGRGRVEANEYTVKWHLLRDQALRGRSDEALVRVIVPVAGSEEKAFQQAQQVAAQLVPAVFRAAPA